MDPIVAIFVFIAVIGLTALLFGSWAIIAIVKALAGGIRSITRPLLLPTSPPPPLSDPAVANSVRCGRLSCTAINPGHARFCRRCGQNLTNAAKRVGPMTAADVELDRVLAKIAAHGMGSLTHAESLTLRDATEQRRRVAAVPFPTQPPAVAASDRNVGAAGWRMRS